MTSYSKQSSDRQYSQYDQFNQSISSINDPMVNNDPMQYCVGVDLGSSKITICRTSSEENNTDSIADMMDIRSIPNLIVFPQTKDQPRSFGNYASFNKALRLDKLSNGDLTKTIFVPSNDDAMPIYIIKGMIIGHVKKIIDHRIKNLSKTVIVPSYSDRVSNVYFETFGIKVMHNSSNLNFISSSNALILSYVERYVELNKSLVNKNIAMIDMGHSKTQITLFTITNNRDKNGGVVINHHNTYNLEGLSGELIDEAFCLHIADTVKNKYPNFRLDKTGQEYIDSNTFRSICIKAKHQLSINQTVLINFQGLDMDICITVTRREFDDILTKNNFGNILKKTLVQILFEQFIDLPDQIYCIEVIGGISRIPFFRSLIQSSILDESRVKIDVNYTMNPDEAVGNGASFYGHLLNKSNGLVSFHRIVNNDVTIFHQGADFEEYLFEKSEIILTNFVETKIDSFSDSYGSLHDNNRSDVRSTRISDCPEFVINIGNVTMRVNLPKYCNRVDSNYIPFIDVYVRYNLCDLIEVIAIKNDRNELLDFTVEILLTNITSSIPVHHDLQSIENKFKEIETKFRNNEDVIERRSAVANFMESYYLNVENVNKVITAITTDQIKKQVDRTVGTVKDVNSIPTNKLVCPLKEIYEFYQFCRSYGQEPDNENDEKKRKNIESLLNDEYALQQLERAVHIVKNIMQHYHR